MLQGANAERNISKQVASTVIDSMNAEYPLESEGQQLAIEREKLAIENQKLDIEAEKLKVERFKAWSMGVSIFVPLLIAVLTIAYNVKLQEERARVDFELKAAEIVMAASSPAAATNKAIVLTELFPDRLSMHFRETFKKLYGDSNQPAEE